MRLVRVNGELCILGKNSAMKVMLQLAEPKASWFDRLREWYELRILEAK